MLLVCLEVLICTHQKYLISWIVINWLTTIFVTMVPTFYNTPKIKPSKGTTGKISMSETM